MSKNRRTFTMTEEQVRAHAARNKLPVADGLASAATSLDAAQKAKEGPQQVEVTLKKAKEPRMTQAEKLYAGHLDAMQRRGDIIEWSFEPLSLRCGDGIVYSPDFVARVCGDVAIAELVKLAGYTALDAVGYCEAQELQRRLINYPARFAVTEIKAKNRAGKGFISRDAKPRFLAARERHPWARFQMLEKQPDGSFKQLL